MKCSLHTDEQFPFLILQKGQKNNRSLFKYTDLFFSIETFNTVDITAPLYPQGMRYLSQELSRHSKNSR